MTVRDPDGRVGACRRPSKSGATAMPNSKALSPDSTAERTALWRALHLQADAPPHV